MTAPNDYYPQKLPEEMFHPCPAQDGLPKAGTCWEIDKSIGGGYYWIYHSNKGYNVKIHSFWFHKDTVTDMSFPECLSVTWYASISGDELSPYRPLRSRVIKSFLGGYAPFRALIHKDVPIVSIGIEYEPSYYEPYLKSQYGAAYQSPQDAFRCIDETADFPEMEALLAQARHYNSTGLPADLFYDAKASEALSLVFDRHRHLNKAAPVSLSPADAELLRSVSDYIRDHCADELPLELLSQIACMGTTKLKKTFKSMFGSTISDYIAAVRLNQAQRLLDSTDLSVGQIAQAVGYTNAGRFSAMFRTSMGVLPTQYRKQRRRWSYETKSVSV